MDGAHKKLAHPLVSIQLIAYTPAEMSTVQYLLNTQSVTEDWQLESLPQIGYLAIDEDSQIPIACGFLRLVEGGFAQIDTLVSNKDFHGSIRHESLTQVIHTLIAIAKAFKIKGIIAFTKDEGVLRRAEDYQFKTLQDKVIVLPLK